MAAHPRVEHLSDGAINGNAAEDVFFVGASSDGSKIFFETDEPLTADDTDAENDVYERSGGATRRISVGTVNGNGVFWAGFAGASADGSRVFFETEESLVAGDTDTADDIYERSGGVTTQVSVGTINGNGAFDARLRDISDDGTIAFFQTAESLGASDTDTAVDVYERSGGVTQRQSKGTINGNGAMDAELAGASPDGLHLFIVTHEPLLPGDTDAVVDIYERTAGVTTQVSAGAINGNGPHHVEFERVSADGMRVLFTTAEQLVAADTDASDDLYRRQGGSTFQVSSGAINGNGAFDVGFEGASDDASRIFFRTSEPLVAGDTDTALDVYERSGGVTTQVTAGAVNGNGPNAATLSGWSSDGTIVFFRSQEQLTADDTDGAYDIYQRSAGATTRVSVGSINGNGTEDAFFGAASADGTRVFFRTNEQLGASDTDTQGDAYERAGGVTNHVSPGNGGLSVSIEGASADGSVLVFGTDESVVAGDEDLAYDLYGVSLPAIPPVTGTHSRYERVSAGRINGNGAFEAGSAGVSADGAKLFFETDEALVGADTDTSKDVYQRSNGVTTRVSTGTAGGNGAFDAEFLASSSDGSRVYFETEEALVAADTDGSSDVYGRVAGVTILISTGPAGGNGAFDAEFHAVSSDGTRVFFSTSEQLVAADTDVVEDIYRRIGLSTTRISSGAVNGNGAIAANFRHVTPDGTRVFFDTTESLVAGDTDIARDIYERTAGVTTQVSAGAINGNGGSAATYAGASDDGTRVFFTTNEVLVASDTDAVSDVYRRYNGATAHISKGAINGNGAISSSFVGTSGDGTRVFISTTEALAATDTDAIGDLYERTGGITTHLTVGAINGNGAFPALYSDASSDGTKVFFHTYEPLVAGDTDAAEDVYERSGGTTTLLSSGNINGNGPHVAGFLGASLDGTTVFIQSDESLDAADTDAVADIYARTGGVTTQLTPGNSPAASSFEGASDDGSTVVFDTDEATTADDEDLVGDVYAVYRAP